MSGSGMGSGSGYTRATHDVEGQNDERLDGLLGKVKMLKDVGVCALCCRFNAVTLSEEE